MQSTADLFKIDGTGIYDWEPDIMSANLACTPDIRVLLVAVRIHNKIDTLEEAFAQARGPVS